MDALGHCFAVVIGAGDLGVFQRHFDTVDEFDVQAGTSLRHLVVTGGRVVISERDGRQAKFGGGGGQLGRMVRAV